MKDYRVRITISHESFNGYTHHDREVVYKVRARSGDSARNKALKLAQKDNKGYELRVTSTMLCDTP